MLDEAPWSESFTACARALSSETAAWRPEWQPEADGCARFPEKVGPSRHYRGRWKACQTRGRGNEIAAKNEADMILARRTPLRTKRRQIQLVQGNVPSVTDFLSRISLSRISRISKGTFRLSRISQLVQGNVPSVTDFPDFRHGFPESPRVRPEFP
jgi:hypothetical protein